ncbi:Hpt domain-containing protein [Aquitalea sp. ASV15]|uniref:Hpt domain-containing protein n=1 Tax=Aquitalea sp. ASV15 TaxID=2795104 RepID=UPI0018EC101E|nr:Hpt domain-containing protein [Aquitalea sp. ASV15]
MRSATSTLPGQPRRASPQRQSMIATCLPQLLATVHEACRPAAEQHGLAWQLDTDAALAPALLLHPLALPQLLQQLLAATIRYTRSGGILLRTQLLAQQQLFQIIAIEIMHAGRPDDGPAAALAALLQQPDRACKAAQPPACWHSIRRLARLSAARLQVASGSEAGCQLIVQLRAEVVEAGQPDHAVPASLPVLDPRVLRMLYQDDWPQQRALLQAFLRDKQADLHALLQAWHSGDLQALGLLAHRIKGASRNVGACALAQAAAQVEQAARSQLHAGLPGLLRALEQALQSFASALQEAPDGPLIDA